MVHRPRPDARALDRLHPAGCGGDPRNRLLLHDEAVQLLVRDLRQRHPGEELPRLPECPETVQRLAVIQIIIYVYKIYINQLLQIRWRKSMTDFFVARWLAPAQHYRLRMVTGPADNPDQRISEDVHNFVGQTMVLSIGLFGNIMRLGIFLYVLWELSKTFPMTSFGASFNIPGYLIYFAVLYAAAGTLITHLIGRASDPPEIRAGALRGEFSLQHGALAGEQRADRTARRRGRRTRAAWRALQFRDGHRLCGDRTPEEAELVQLLLRPVLGRLSLSDPVAGLFLREGHLRHLHADDQRVLERARRPDLVRGPVRDPGRIPRHRAAIDRVRGGAPAGDGGVHPEAAYRAHDGAEP